ncbi:DUF1801 domain-containing protein [Vibrio methylphosphonaticus]|uniref:DUF1801 domain-containing protein n=1 Tax=Vibrio methylphosphonaticus TaxID=2946866 RepID=UPI0025431CBD
MEVISKFDDYPSDIRRSLLDLRSLIFQCALTLDVGDVEEALKWGEPSYRVKCGSPIRIDWKLKTPHNYYLYFNCSTQLVDTFRELYSDVLEFQGNRAIVLSVAQSFPERELKHCIALAMTYQRIKHLPLLGAS